MCERDSISAMKPWAALVLFSVTLCAKPLDIYVIDVEGGQATLIHSPSGQSMLVDTGWPGFNGRDGDRILQTAKKAGIKQIDYVLITHWHTDHVGGIEQLVERIPVKTIIIHGPNTETGKQAESLNAAYERASKGKHILTVKPGDTIPLKGVDVQVVAARGVAIVAPLPGAGEDTPSCSESVKKETDTGENARSTGFILTHGKFKFSDLADLTWNKELELVCPKNLLGTVDVYLTNHHGLATSNPPQLLAALKPRVAVMNNGARKGGSAEAIKIVRATPGLEDLWQLHYSVASPKEVNVPDSFIANVDEIDEGFGVKVAAEKDGSFTVTNARNKYSKAYAAKR